MNSIIRRLFLGLIAVLSGLVAIGAVFFAMSSLQQQKQQDVGKPLTQAIFESPTPEILSKPTPAIPNTTEPDPVTSDVVYTN